MLVLLLSSIVAVSRAAAPLVVMHYNLWNFDSGPNWYRRKDQIAQAIKSSTLVPDIISFNEVRKRKSNDGAVTEDMFEDMKKLLPEYPHGYYRVGEDYGNVEEGVAVVSRHPIIDKDFINLKLGQGGDSNHRTLIYIRVKLPGHTTAVSMFVTHWSYDRAQQLGNARETVAFVKSKPGPHILSGDLNIYADYEDPMEVMHIHNGDVFFRDTGFEWKTDLKEEGYTFSSWDPHNRADRILIRGPGLSVARMEKVGQSKSRDQAPSDHMGVVVKLLVYQQNLVSLPDLENVKKLKSEREQVRVQLVRDVEHERSARATAEHELAEAKQDIMRMRQKIERLKIYAEAARPRLHYYVLIVFFLCGLATSALLRYLYSRVRRFCPNADLPDLLPSRSSHKQF